MRQGAPAPHISSLSLALRGPPADTGRWRGAGRNTSHRHCVESPWPWSLQCGIHVSVGLGGQSTTRSRLSCCREATSPTTSGRFLLLPVPCASQLCLLRVLRGFTETLCTGPADCLHCTRVCFAVGMTVPPVVHSRITPFRSASVGPPILCQALCQMVLS